MWNMILLNTSSKLAPSNTIEISITISVQYHIILESITYPLRFLTLTTKNKGPSLVTIVSSSLKTSNSLHTICRIQASPSTRSCRSLPPEWQHTPKQWNTAWRCQRSPELLHSWELVSWKTWTHQLAGQLVSWHVWKPKQRSALLRLQLV